MPLVTDIDYGLEDAIEQLCYDIDTFDISNSDNEDFETENMWYPDEYVILVNGFRGSGKSVLVCYWGGWYLEEIDEGVEVYTNLAYNIPKLMEDGFTKLPRKLEWEKMISMKAEYEQPLGALNQIDEVDTFLDKLRTNTNQNVLATKFLEQLRKRSLKFIFSCQFGNYLPYGTLDQVDLIIDAQDLFFTYAGREAGLQKGKRFLYTCRDKSGYFTGGREEPWFMALQGEPIWPYFSTSELHDPTQFARKFEINAGTVDTSTGDVYFEGEESAHRQEQDFRKYKHTASLLHGSPLMSYIFENAEVFDVQDNGNKIKVSINKIDSVIANRTDPRLRKGLKQSFNAIKGIAEAGSEVIKRERNNLIILKPEAFIEYDSNGTPLEEVNEQKHPLGWQKVEY